MEWTEEGVKTRQEETDAEEKREDAAAVAEAERGVGGGILASSAVKRWLVVSPGAGRRIRGLSPCLANGASFSAKARILILILRAAFGPGERLGKSSLLSGMGGGGELRAAGGDSRCLPRRRSLLLPVKPRFFSVSPCPRLFNRMRAGLVVPLIFRW